jgi:hypothetical protein
VARPGPVQAPVEHAAYGVARQVLKDRIDVELVGPWRPRLARQQAPRPFLQPRLRHAVDGLTSGVCDAQAAPQQTMAEQPAGRDRQRPAGAGAVTVHASGVTWLRWSAPTW